MRLETRAPLDLRLLRFLVRLPPIPRCAHKELSRQAMKGYLPERILDLERPKAPLPKDPVELGLELEGAPDVDRGRRRAGRPGIRRSIGRKRGAGPRKWVRNACCASAYNLAQACWTLKLPDAMVEGGVAHLWQRPRHLSAQFLRHSIALSLLERAMFRMNMAGGGIAGYLLRLSLSPTEEDWEKGSEERRSWLWDAVRRPFRLIRKYGHGE